jgi:large subunit ribosomal protein L35e
LATLRVQQTAGGNSAKVARIGVVRKAIARVLTVTNQKTKAGIKENLTGKLPKNMREKKTRAIRRRLTTEQMAKKTVKAAKKATYFPKRVYAIKA